MHHRRAKIQEREIIVSLDVEPFTYHGESRISRTTETGNTSSNHGPLEFRFKINLLPVHPIYLQTTRRRRYGETGVRSYC